jgi:GH15 family glucan-1,4-alpha-glucosidase
MADERDFASLEQVGEMAWAMHDQPDAGLWEFRTRQEVHTYSAVMSWAACDRLANAAAHLGKHDRAALWSARAADACRANPHRLRSLGGESRWRPLRRQLRKRLPRCQPAAAGRAALSCARRSAVRVHLRTVEKALRRGEHMLRYAQEDDFGAPETAFNICTFWLIDALARSERATEARELFTSMLSHMTPSGLLSEDMDLDTGELWGNFPQTYSLVGVINCAGLLSRSWNTIR